MSSSFDEKVVESVKELLEGMLIEEGLELVDIEYRSEGRGRVLRIYIDKEGGVTLGECTKISREVGYLLDVHDVVPGSYNLEVSSPGLTRALKKAKDFERFKGKKVKIKTKFQIDGKNVFRGKLLDFQKGIASLEAEGNIYSIPFGEIEKASLDFEILNSKKGE